MSKVDNKSEEVCYSHKLYSPDLDKEAESFELKMLYVLEAIALLEPFVFGAIINLFGSQ